MWERKKEGLLDFFLNELGIKREIDILEEPIDYYFSDRNDLPKLYSTRGRKYTEWVIDGCKEIVEFIATTKDKDKSILLWNCLLGIIKAKCSRYHTLSELLSGICSYFYRSSQQISFVSSDEIRLQKTAWLVNREGEFVSAEQLTQSSIAEEYDTKSDGAQNLFEFLKIAKDEELSEDDEDNFYLTDSQREKIEFVDRLKAMGIDESDLEELQRIKQQRESRQQAPEQSENKGGNENSQISGDDLDYDIFSDDFDPSADKSNTDGHQHRKLNKTTSKVVRDIVRCTKDTPSVTHDAAGEEEETDYDEYMPSAVDYSKQIE